MWLFIQWNFKLHQLKNLQTCENEAFTYIKKYFHWTSFTEFKKYWEYNQYISSVLIALKLVEIDWNWLKLIEIDWNWLKLIEIDWNWWKLIEIDWKWLKLIDWLMQSQLQYKFVLQVIGSILVIEFYYWMYPVYVVQQ